jgi:hypothetical protein
MATMSKRTICQETTMVHKKTTKHAITIFRGLVLGLLVAAASPSCLRAENGGQPTPAVPPTITPAIPTVDTTVPAESAKSAKDGFGPAAFCGRACYCPKPLPCLSCLPTCGMCVPYCCKPLPCGPCIPCYGIRACYCPKPAICIPNPLVCPACCNVPSAIPGS